MIQYTVFNRNIININIFYHLRINILGTRR
jgi:hypothetical protein